MHQYQYEEHQQGEKVFHQSHHNEIQNKYTLGEQPNIYLSLQQQIRSIQCQLFSLIIQKCQQPHLASQQNCRISQLCKPLLYQLSCVQKQILSIQQKLQSQTYSLNLFQRQQLQQKLIQQRMKQLAHVKVLVNTYRHHQYRLVLGHWHIANSYIRIKCFQQAAMHFAQSIAVNQKYTTQTRADYFHSFLLTFYAKALFGQGQVENCLAELNKALEIHQQLMADHVVVNDYQTLNLISQVLSIQGQYEQSISYGRMLLASAQKRYGLQTFEYANAHKTLGEVFANAQQFQQSIVQLKKGLSILQVSNPQRQQLIIQFHTILCQTILRQLTLSPQTTNHFTPYILALQTRYTTIENTYGYRDKRCIKQKRHLASSLLKYGKIDQAEEQLQDIVEIQEIVFGQKSVEVAKTLKLLGTINLSQHQLGKAERYLRKSLTIFHDQGHVNLQKQVQAKLLLLSGQSKHKFNKI